MKRLFVFYLLMVSVSLADDVTTTSGSVYKEVTSMDFSRNDNASVIVILYKDGKAFVAPEMVPSDIAKKYGVAIPTELDSLTAKDGTVYKKLKNIKVLDDSIQFIHDSGVAGVPAANLTDEDLKKFHLSISAPTPPPLLAIPEQISTPPSPVPAVGSGIQVDPKVKYKVLETTASGDYRVSLIVTLSNSGIQTGDIFGKVKLKDKDGFELDSTTVDAKLDPGESKDVSDVVVVDKDKWNKAVKIDLAQ